MTLSCLWTTVGEISATATNMELARVYVGVSTKENSNSNGAGCSVLVPEEIRQGAYSDTSI